MSFKILLIKSLKTDLTFFVSIFRHYLQKFLSKFPQHFIWKLFQKFFGRFLISFVGHLLWNFSELSLENIFGIFFDFFLQYLKKFQQNIHTVPSVALGSITTIRFNNRSKFHLQFFCLEFFLYLLWKFLRSFLKLLFVISFRNFLEDSFKIRHFFLKLSREFLYQLPRPFI